MKHLRRTIEVAVAVIAAAYSSALASPAATDFLAHHPQDAAYVSLGAGILIAGYKAARDKLTPDVPAPPSTGSSMAAK